jgi:hypothetical protein
MKCTIFSQCRGTGGDTQVSGNAFSAMSSDDDISNCLFYQCWNSTDTVKDNVGNCNAGIFEVTQLNFSKCMDNKIGAASIAYTSAKAGFSVSFVYVHSCNAHNGGECWASPITISYYTIVNNTFANAILYANGANGVFTVEKSYFVGSGSTLTTIENSGSFVFSECRWGDYTSTLVTHGATVITYRNYDACISTWHFTCMLVQEIRSEIHKILMTKFILLALH